MVVTRTGSYRPPVMGTTHAVSSGHYLASAAGMRILENGGNAIDAGVAAWICLNVLLPEMCGFGGVAPVMVYLATEDRVLTLSGVGPQTGIGLASLGHDIEWIQTYDAGAGGVCAIGVDRGGDGRKPSAGADMRWEGYAIGR